MSLWLNGKFKKITPYTQSPFLIKKRNTPIQNTKANE
jgi:hypothetical protein